ncbi:MAG: ATP-binding protein [Deltaproteobacteria bacterium]|nr:ATP-binding protein [Deltaproteobacteria bacterium]
MSRRILLSWSSGKDSAWSLHVLRTEHPEVEVVGLLTTFNASADRVAMHAVRHELVAAQARAAGLPLWTVPLPAPCSNAEYDRRMMTLVARARAARIDAIAFGDLFLADIRAYRERQLAGTGIAPLFPLWGTPSDTPRLAEAMLAGGLRAILTSVDPRQLAPHFAGRRYDAALLAALPAAVDPCGERGEFHTFCYAGPMFRRSIDVRVGSRVNRDGFAFADVLPAGTAAAAAAR